MIRANFLFAFFIVTAGLLGASAHGEESLPNPINPGRSREPLINPPEPPDPRPTPPSSQPRPVTGETSDRFTSRLTPQRFGTDFTFDLSSGVVPDYKEHGVTDTEDEIRRKGLNFLLNFTSRSPELVRVNKEDIHDGRITLNEFGSKGGKTVELNDVLNMDGIQFLQRIGKIKNPYSCPGDESNVYRADFLASVISSPEVYYEVARLPPNWGDLAKQLGVSTNPPGQTDLNFNKNKVVVEEAKLTLGSAPRVLEFESRRGKLKRTVYRSYDFSSHPVHGEEEEFSDIGAHPTDFKAKAGEFIFSLDNGFQGYYLAGGDGKRQELAPADVVVSKSSLGPKTVSAHKDPAVRAPFDCMRCHSGGLLGEPTGFSISTLTGPKVEKLLLTEEAAKTAEKGYTTGEKYDKQTKEDSDTFVQAIKEADAYVKLKNKKPAPIVADFAGMFRKNITSLAQMARELGFKDEPKNKAEDQLKAALSLPRNATWRKRLGFSEDKVTNEGLSISRKEWGNLFCDLKSTLIEQKALRPIPVNHRNPGTNLPEPRPDAAPQENRTHGGSTKR